MEVKIFDIQKTLKSRIKETRNLNGLQYECVYADCKEVFLNLKLWKIHFDKHVNIYFF